MPPASKRGFPKLGSKRSYGVTIKERKFVKALVETGSPRKAALMSYDVKSKQNASTTARAVLQRPIVQEHLKQILERKGLSVEDLGDKLYQSIHTNLEGGKPSQAVAASLIQFAYKLHDVIPSTKTVSAHLNVNSNQTPDDMDDLTQMLRTITEQNAQLLKEMKK